MNNYIRMIKEMYAKNDKKTLENDAYTSIIRALQDNIAEKDIDDLDYIPTNKPVQDGKIYLGNIYTFVYNAEHMSEYQFGGKTIKFTDTYPMVIVTKVTLNMVRGINLNLCNMGLKTIILNLIYDIDEKYYGGGYIDMAMQRGTVFSPNVLKFFALENIEQKLNGYLMRIAKINSYDILFRSYSIDKIRLMREVNPSLWKHIPFLTFGELKKAGELSAIYKLTGIDRIKIV